MFNKELALSAVESYENGNGLSEYELLSIKVYYPDIYDDIEEKEHELLERYYSKKEIDYKKG